MASLRLPVVSTLVAGLLAGLTMAQDSSNSILYPSSTDLTFHYLDTIDVAYVTDYETPWLYLWCLDSTGANQQIVYYSPSDLEGKTSLAVQLQSHTEYTGSTCWFNLTPEQPASDDELIGVSGAKFSYIKEEGSQQTFSMDSASATVTSTSTPSSTAITTTAVTTTTSASTNTTSFTTTTTAYTHSANTTSATATASQSPVFTGGASRGTVVGVAAGMVAAAIAALAV